MTARKINIFLDDVREPPPGVSWKVVRTPAEAIFQLIVQTGNVEMLSLDHDMGDESTGYDVLLFLEQNLFRCPEKICLHTANSSARQKMKLAVQSFERRLLRQILIP